jgi:transposase-like protein
METLLADTPLQATVPDAAEIPRTLSEALRRYATPDLATMAFSAIRWPNGIECPHCRSQKKHSYVSTRHIWKCKSCRKQFSPKAGTIFEDSPISLDKWFTAVWMVANDQRRANSYRLHQALGVTQTTAQFILRRIRLATTESTLSNQEDVGSEEHARFVRLLKAIAAVPKNAIYELDPRMKPKSKPAS